VFELFNAEPPGTLASLGLLTVHASAFIVALIAAVIFAAFHQPIRG